MKKINWTKVKAAAIGFAVVEVPVVTAAFGSNASSLIKWLSLASGTLGILGRAINPKDPAYGLVKLAQTELDAKIASQSKK